MSTYNKILKLADSYIQKTGFHGFSYADLSEGIGIKKASIHYYFPNKSDLGLAYCDFKIEVFNALDTALKNIPPGLKRLKGYLDAFSGCAERGEMCGIYAMLSDSHLLIPELQDAVGYLAQLELRILTDILVSGKVSGEMQLNNIQPEELAVIVCSALKGALMLNRLPPHNAYAETVVALMIMFDAS